ncbi:SIMPL domain-containing protein [Dasania marina]|uniref:SIMPL domain-containing protein n=1 Tax=Dasania marina TaxID=471499 RepID=UPI0030DD5636|tara:strand:- start:28510 stop:29301 length:792 start_codon:yes stop_codon:yes gene_type:complete
MKTIAMSLLAVMFSVAASAEPEVKGGPEELRRFLHPKDSVVSIHASAEQTAYSDIAIVNLVFTTEEKSLSQALANNSALRAQVSQQLLAAGIAADKINSAKFATSPQFGWFGSKPSSYKVINRMAVEISEESHLKTLATVADESAAIDLSDTSFKHSQKDEFNNKVKQLALKKVMQQKAFYESSLGVILTPVNFREGGMVRAATRGAAMMEGVVLSAQKAKRTVQDAAMSYMGQPKEEASFDEVVYRADLTVDFKIEPKVVKN